MQFFSFFSKDIGIDLGTTNTLIHVEERGIKLIEPSVVAIERSSNQIIAVGLEARAMLGRTPNNISAIRPMRDGVIADFEIVEKMIRYFISKVTKRSLIKPRIAIGIPTGITEVERRAVQESCEQAGAREIYLIEEPLAAAIGAQMPTSDPIGNLIVDIGGGTTEIAVISLGSIVIENSIRVGGDEIDRCISYYIREKHNLVIGERTAEEIKMNFVDVWNYRSQENYTIKGRDSISGLPRNLNINKAGLREGLEEPLAKIVSSIKNTLDQTPPELVSDIMEQGIVLTGGGALLKGIKHLIASETGVPVIIAQNPLQCVVCGTGLYLQQLSNLNNKKKKYIRV